MSASVCLLNYGSGNTGSVLNLFLALGVEAYISNEPADIRRASHLVLPGVGAFGAAMARIHAEIPLPLVREQVLEKQKPFIGICVGMQVLAERGLEFGNHEGLGWIQGTVSKLESGEFPLPHMGWNDIIVKNSSPLLKGLEESVDFYFANSFSLKEAAPETVAAVTSYGEEFPAVVQKGNIYGVQFHPEKSQKAGRLLFENFLRIS